MINVDHVCLLWWNYNTDKMDYKITMLFYAGHVNITFLSRLGSQIRRFLSKLFILSNLILSSCWREHL